MPPDNDLVASTTYAGNEDWILAAFVVFILVSVVIAIPGTILAKRERLVIYDGRSDLALSFAIPVVVLALCANFHLTDWKTWMLGGFVTVLTIISLKKTYQANSGLGKVILAFPTKFVLAGVITLCAVFAVGGALASAESLKKRKYGEAAKQMALAAAAGTGYLKLRTLIQKLIKKPSRSKD